MAEWCGLRGVWPAAVFLVFLTFSIPPGAALAEPTVDLEVVALQRDSSDSNDWVFDRNGSASQSNDIALSDSGGINGDLAGAVRLAVANAVAGASSWRWQLSGFITDEFQDSQTVGGIGNLRLFRNGAFSGVGGLNFDNADIARAEYTSRLGGVEMNALYDLGRGVSLVGGARWVRLDEDFEISFDDIDFAGVATYDIQTNNDFAGAQIGAEGDFLLGRGFRVNLSARGGPLANFARQQQVIIDTTITGGPLRDQEETKIGFAALGDARVRLSYDITSRLRLGLTYQGLVIFGAALAPDQIEKRGGRDGGNGVDTGGAVWLQGGGATLTYTF